MFNPSEMNESKYERNNVEYEFSKSQGWQTENNMRVADYLIAFANQSERYCIGCVDMLNSTVITKELGTTKGALYRQIFLNSMANILSRFGGFVIKNVGDCLLYYFPESIRSLRKFGFMSCIECSLSMIENHHRICEKLQRENLPPVDYRISADYGTVIRIKLKDSREDMIGPGITICSDINHDAPINGVVIGGDLHEQVKSFDEYKFKKINDFSFGFKFSYPLYTITRR